MMTQREKRLKSVRNWNYRSGHRVKSNRVSRKYRQNCRERELMRLGGKCSECGFDEIVCLEFDHIIPKLNARRSGDSNWLHTQKLTVQKALEIFQVLCANCHARKTKNEARSGLYIAKRDGAGVAPTPQMTLFGE